VYCTHTHTHTATLQAYLQGGDFAGVNRTINELHASCKAPDGTDDPAKGSYLLEVYGFVVQLCVATKDQARMREIYPKIMQLNQVTRRCAATIDQLQ
jgi:COP9 signalosome complex subunit 2